MRFKSAAAGDLSGLALKQFAVRWNIFAKLYEKDMKFTVELARAGMGLR